MNIPPEKESHSRIRYRRVGVYDVAYEERLPFSLRIYSLLDELRAIRERMAPAKRLLADAMKLAPMAFIAYIATSFWRGVHSAIHLYWLIVMFDWLWNDSTSQVPSAYAYQTLATYWLYCVMVNVLADSIHARSLKVLTTRFRGHFMPQLIRASLRVDLLSIQDLFSIVPARGDFTSEFPGGRFLENLSQLLQRTLDLTSQLFVLSYAIHSKRSPEREILLCFFIVRGLVWWLVPSNVIGSSAWVYWPNNPHFLRMKALYGLVFTTQYRADLMLDGIASSIENEYDRAAERLGNVDGLEPTPWCTDLRRGWHWDFLMDITLDYPLAVYALIFSTYLSPPSIPSMVLLQQATKSISWSMGWYSHDTPSLLDVCSSAKWLYDAIDHESTMVQGAEPFPRPIEGVYDAGMKISFRNVSLRYPGSDHDALSDVSFDILPGELVLVVGTNGSGKSTMLKLMARLFDPTAGKILIDDMPVERYDADQLRGAMAFQSQAPVVYPVSVRDNIAFSLSAACAVAHADVDAAARRGGCAEWIARLSNGYETRLRASFDVDHGWQQGMSGYPSEALQEELARHVGRPVSISGGEKQRLATARTLLRIHHRTTRLVVADEATSALDPVAERNLLGALLDARAGKTVVLITHRFHPLVHDADRILCIKDGRVVERGTHDQLVRAGGDYAALYHAQVGWEAL